MRKKLSKKQKIIKISVISLTALILAFFIVSLIIVAIIYESIFARFDKPEFSIQPYYEEFTGLERSPVNFKSGKNTLYGYLYGKENTKGLIVIGHGLWGGHEDYLYEIEFFVKTGWKVLGYDNTGSYTSEGKSTRGLSQSVSDMDAALNFIKNNDGLNKLSIMLYGHSWGGHAVTAVLNYGHKVNGVVSLSGYNKSMEMLFEQTKNLMGFFTYLEYPVLWCYQSVKLGSNAWKTAVSGINKSDAKIMIIQGKKDTLVKYDSSGIYAKSKEITNPNVIYKLYEDRSHNDIPLTADAAEYFNKIEEEHNNLNKKYNGKIPYGEQKAFYETVDRDRMSVLSIDFMNEINAFFNSAL